MKIRLFKKSDKSKNSSRPKEALSDKSKFAIVEAYKAARTNIMFSLSSSEKKSFCVTSFSKGEGKSTASSNLAISFSKLDRKVVIVDCDLRRPNLHNILKIDNTKGLSDVIAKMTTLDEAIHHDVIPCLDVLTSGTIPPNPSELICSPAFESLMKRLEEEYDYVIIDSPPVGVVADALMIKNTVAGYIVVLRERSTTHGEIEKIMSNFKLADAKVLGFLKVGCDAKARKSYKNGYYSYQYY